LVLSKVVVYRPAILGGDSMPEELITDELPENEETILDTLIEHDFICMEFDFEHTFFTDSWEQITLEGKRGDWLNISTKELLRIKR